MKCKWFAILVVLLLCIGCAPEQPASTPTPEPTAPGTSAPADPTDLTEIPLPDDEFETPDTTSSAGDTPAMTAVPTQKPSGTATPTAAPTSFDNGITLPEDVF